MRRFGALIALLGFAVSAYAAVRQQGPNPGIFVTAVVVSDTTPPAALTNLSSLAGSSSSVNLTWTSPGDDGATGALTGTFRIFYSSVSADMTGLTGTSSTTSTLLKADVTATAVAPGSTQSTTINSLAASTQYFFRGFSSDEVPNWSTVSNASTATTTSATTDDITWYWNADDASASQSPQKGLGSITLGASWVSTTAVVGTAAIYNSNTGNSGGRITISSTSFNYTQGRLGTYMILREATGSATDGDPIWVNGSTGTSATSKFHIQVSATGNWTFDYSNATQLSLGTGFLTRDTTTYVEFAWDYATTTLGAPCKVYKDGVLTGTCAGTPNAGAPTGSTLRFGGQDSNATALVMDQIIFSTNPVRDLYALRNTTSF